MRRSLALVAAAAVLAGCGSDSSPTGGERAEPAGVRDVTSVLALRAAFNADRGKPRLLLILSPT